MSEAIAQQVDDLITNNLVVVFSKSYCPHCTKAVATLKKIGRDPVVVELDEVDEGEAKHEYLKKKTGHRTVPAIFIKSKLIGGNSELQDLHEKKQLDALFN